MDRARARLFVRAAFTGLSIEQALLGSAGDRLVALEVGSEMPVEVHGDLDGGTTGPGLDLLPCHMDGT